MTMTYLTLILPLIVQASICHKPVQEDINGLHITSIPRNLSPNITYLRIFKTNITILNLTVIVDYPIICRIDVISSPIANIITPGPLQSVTLKSFLLHAAGHYLRPPDLGLVLAGQLINLSLKALGITAIPDNYFQNFTNLYSLSLASNPITNLNETNLAGLDRLKHFYLGYTHLNPLPPLQLWLPRLQTLYTPYSGITTIPLSFWENMSGLRCLNLTGNKLTTIPAHKYFIHMQTVVKIKLRRNPIHCDSRLCWIKVISCEINYWQLCINEMFSLFLLDFITT